MKRQTNPKQLLRVQSLDTKALQQVQGGRGTQCGATWHCLDCGAESPLNASNCEGCGSPLQSGGGGGGGGGCPDDFQNCAL